MSRLFRSFLSTFPLSLLALTATSAAYASSYGEVNKAEWTGGTTVPDHISMFMATPDVMPEKPPIVVNIHACGGNNANSQWSYEGFNPLKAALDSVGFIMILPSLDNQTRNCFDSGSEGALTRGGNDDLSAIVQMVQYVIDTHNADPSRVYVLGGSGGGMATQALLGVYPDVFKAGHARAGAPAGCWGVDYSPDSSTGTPQWSQPCASGSVNKTPQEWGDLVRSYHPDYTGPRPRVQINQGTMDTTISFNNFREGMEEWINVLGLSEEPTSTQEGVVGANTFSNGDPAPHTYNIQTWNDACGYPVLDMWAAQGNSHSMGYEAQHILEFFGLDQTREQDPWDEMCGDFVDPGGTGGGSGEGAGGSDAGVGGASAGVGGMDAGPGAGGAVAAGGAASGVGGAGAAAGGTTGVSAGGTSNSGGAGVAPNTGGAAAGVGGSGVAPDSTEESGGGCSLVAGPRTGGAFAWALVLLGYGIRRRRSSTNLKS